jgi:DNA repair protein SbcD/Mre11
MKLVHAADLHLDSPLRGLERYEGAPLDRIRGATRRALENLVDLCRDEGADVLLLAGDLYDGDWKDYATGLFFAAQMSRLREADVQVFAVRGNHDAQSQITHRMALPSNVRELSWEGPEAVHVEALGLAVHGQSFARAATTEDLASAYPDAVPGWLNVGLLHTALSGREGHDTYAPCTVDTLRSKGYDYWALGHVHAREVVSEEPWVVFPGNLQGRHARETGAKGATVVAVEEGRIRSVEHRALDVVRWVRLTVDAGEAGDADDVVDLVREALEGASASAEGRLLVARLEVAGATGAHAALSAEPDRYENTLRALATDVGEVWLEKVRFRTRPSVDVEALLGREDAVGELVRALRGMPEDEAQVRSLSTELADLARKLPVEARHGEDGVRLDDPEYVRDALQDVEGILLGRLLGGEDGE